MPAISSKTEGGTQLAAAKAPATIGLVIAASIAFAAASFTVYDAYSDLRARAAEVEISPPGDPESDPRGQALAEEVRRQQALAERRLAELQRVTAEAERQKEASSADLQRCGEAERRASAAEAALSRCEEAGRRVSANLARIERDLGAIGEQTDALERAIRSVMDGELWEELAAPLARLRRAINESREFVRAERGRVTAAAASPTRPTEMMLAMAEPEPGGPSRAALAWTRIYIVIGMLAVLGLAFLGAVAAIFTTKRPAVLTFAIDTVKTILGFFVGVLTSFMSVPWS